MNSCATRTDGEPRFGVHILDWSADRAKLVEAICRASGHPLELLVVVPARSSPPSAPSSGSLGLVGLSAGSAIPEEWAKILELKVLGFAVLGYRTDAESLPLATRCELMLAGCTEILDSNAPGFPAQPRTALD